MKPTTTRTILSHAGPILLLTSTVLLLIAVLSSPIANNIGILRVTTPFASGDRMTSVTFGTFGYCVLGIDPKGTNTDSCAPPTFGYDPTPILSSINQTPFDPATTSPIIVLSKALGMLHPLATAACFVSFIMATVSLVVGSESWTSATSNSWGGARGGGIFADAGGKRNRAARASVVVLRRLSVLPPNADASNTAGASAAAAKALMSALISTTTTLVVVLGAMVCDMVMFHMVMKAVNEPGVGRGSVAQFGSGMGVLVGGLFGVVGAVGSLGGVWLMGRRKAGPGNVEEGKGRREDESFELEQR